MYMRSLVCHSNGPEEVDGWEWHGKYKGDFQRDRERQNLLTLNGWRILRFTAADIRGDIQAGIGMVTHALALAPVAQSRA